MIPRKLFLLTRGAATSMMKIQPAIIKTFSCSSSMSIRRPLDQSDVFENEEPISRNKYKVDSQSQDSEASASFSASEYEGPGEKSINQVTLLGRVGLEPQIRGTEENPVTTFNLATNSSWRNINSRAGDSEWNKRTDWHNVVVFKPGLRELAYNNIVKGSRLHVTGKLMYGEYLDRQGVKRQTTSIVCDDIIFLSAKKGNM